MKALKQLRSLVKNDISEREFFSSPLVERHFDIVGKIVSERYGNFPLKVNLTQNGDWIAYTDNQVVNINTENVLCSDCKTIEDRYLRVLGFLGHELGHVLYTDFDNMVLLSKSLCNGKWVPQRPVFTEKEDKEKLERFEKMLPSISTKAIMQLIHNINNSLEDGYVNKKITSEFSGTFNIGINAYLKKQFEGFTLLKESGEENDFANVCNLILLASIMKNEWRPAYEKKYPVFKSILPLIEHYKQSDNPDDRFDTSNKVFILIWDYIEKLISKEQQGGQESGQGEAQGNDNSSSSGQEQSSNGESSKGSKSSNGNASNKDSSNGQNSSKTASNSNDRASDEKRARPNQKDEGAPCEKDSRSSEKENETLQKMLENAKNNFLNKNNKEGRGPGVLNDELRKKSEAESENEDGQGSDKSEKSDENKSLSNDGQSSEKLSKNVGADNEKAADSDTAETKSDVKSATSKKDALSEKTISNAESEGSDKRDSVITDVDEMGKSEENLSGDKEISGYDSDIDLGFNVDSALKQIINDYIDNVIKNDEERVSHIKKENAIKEISRTEACHAGIQSVLNEVKIPTSNSVRTAYDMIFSDIESISKHLQRGVVEVLKDKKEGARESGLLCGNKINPGATASGDGKIFSKNRMPDEIPNLAVSLLIDESGSMSGDRIKKAMEMSMLIEDFCRKAEIPVSIVGHSVKGNETVYLNQYINYEETNKNAKYKIGTMSAGGCNRDGFALKYCYDMLVRREEPSKLLIIVSDGRPNANGYGGNVASDDLQAIKANCKKHGIALFAAAIGSDKDHIREIYGDSFMDITNLNELPKKMIKLVQKFVNQ